MTVRRGRRCRAALSLALRAAGIGLLAVIVPAVPGTASTDQARIDDPRDVGTRLDVKALTHGDDPSSITYTVETFAPFTDQLAVFKWGIDRDHDENFDLIVFTEWTGGKLTAGVRDASGKQVAPASVSRPGPTVIKVSFPATVLGGAPVYRYGVGAGPGEGERDLAPNSGLIQHRLGAAPAVAEAKEARAASSAPAKPPAVASPPAEVATPPAAVTAAPRRASGGAPAANLPTTGPEDRALLPWAGSALMIGGVLVALGTQRNRLRRGEGTGGIR